MIQSTKRILIVDDEAPMRFLLSKQLSRAGFDVKTAADGPSALAAAAAEAIDAIVLDVVMPGMDGFEVCRRLKADPQTAPIPVIFLSASCSGDFRRRAFRHGAADFLAKPFQTEQLPAYLRALLGATGHEAPSPHTGRVVCVTGPVRSDSAAAAVRLAEEDALQCGCPVMLIDLELPAGVIGARLQLSGGPNVRLLLQDTGDPITPEIIEGISQRLHFGLEVIPAPFAPSPLGHDEPDEARLAELIDVLTEQGYYVVLHVGAKTDALATAAMRLAATVYSAGRESEEALRGAWLGEIAAAGIAGDRVVPLPDNTAGGVLPAESVTGRGRARPARQPEPLLGRLSPAL